MVRDMVEKKIVWEKWIDPLNSNIDEVEYPGHNAPAYDQDKHVEFLSLDPDFEEKMMNEDPDYAEDASPGKQLIYNPTRIVSTGHGFVSLTEHSYASKHFDFWTLHYNHDITKELLEAIEKCEGVETMNPLTRYRVRIGLNRPLLKSGSFNLNEIRKNIEDCILNFNDQNNLAEETKELLMFDKEVIDYVRSVKKKIREANWAIYVLPNGKVETILSSKSNKIFDEKLELLKEAQKMIGGKILRPKIE